MKGISMNNTLTIGVCGAHMQGLPLNHQLVSLGAKYVKTCKTVQGYRLFNVPQKTPPRPGLLRDTLSPFTIELELWEMPLVSFGAFIMHVASPLCIGTILLEDGSSTYGFLCEADALKNAEEISQFGGWRKYQKPHE